jgi:hypothetical protein
MELARGGRARITSAQCCGRVALLTLPPLPPAQPARWRVPGARGGWWGAAPPLLARASSKRSCGWPDLVKGRCEKRPERVGLHLPAGHSSGCAPGLALWLAGCERACLSSQRSSPRRAPQVALEAIARLAWSDDEVRESVASEGGIRATVDVMALHSGSDAIQCNGCLVLMSLVRGEGEVCASNQWLIAKAGAVEVIVAAMRAYRRSAMVQLSVLLAFIPMALENAMMQAHITQVGGVAGRGCRWHGGQRGQGLLPYN